MPQEPKEATWLLVRAPRLFRRADSEKKRLSLTARRGDVVQERRRHQVLYQATMCLECGTGFESQVVVWDKALEEINHLLRSIELFASHHNVVTLVEVGQHQLGRSEGGKKNLHHGATVLARLLFQPLRELLSRPDHGRDVAEDGTRCFLVVGNAREGPRKEPSVHCIQTYSHGGYEKPRDCRNHCEARSCC